MSNHPANPTKITFNQREAEFPMLTPTLGNPVLDIKSFGPKLGGFTLDEGLRSTAFCKSNITFIDGGQGILLHRGYPIAQLAEQCSYLDVCYLLLNSELPSSAQSQAFAQEIQELQQLPSSLSKLIQSFPTETHPMAMLLSCFGGLAGQHQIQTANHKQLDAQQRDAALRVIAQIPMLTAMAYRHKVGKAFIEPRKDFSFSQNFLHMLFADSATAPAPDPTLVRAIDRIFILHADHEQNASTATVRLAGSTGADPFACIAAGIVALWGPQHGGANEAALGMLQQIADPEHIPEYLSKAKDSNDPFRLMGFGHRVYKNYDPRAKVMQQACHEVLAATGAADDPLFKLATELERIAREDDYFTSRKLYPNIDFYSGITLKALGIPSELFTCIFALARSVGWMTNWLEMRNDPDQGLIRPRQLYTGPKQRDIT